MTTGRGRPALRVAAGILLTRILGLVRERVFAHYFGSGFEADAFRAALKIPNAIRNLLGEGTLSASFIPVYAGLIGREEEDRARRLAGTVASLLVLVTAASALAGFVLAPVITDVVVPGFSGETRDLTITLVKILFPMSGIMIMSGWCLGVLNTHRRFFLSYAAPTLWNVAQIATLIGFGGVLAGADLAVALGWGALVGSGLQVMVQLPSTFALSGRLRASLAVSDPDTRRVLTAWVPVVVGAGVLQISSVVDGVLGSLVGPGAVANLGYAQLIAILPVSLFGVSVAAAALPELSREAADRAPPALRQMIADGVERVNFFIIPSTIVLVLLGRHVVAPLYQTGEFGPTQTQIVAAILAAYGVGLPARGLVKLLVSGHYALGDTRTPLWISVLSVAVSTVAAVLLMGRYGAVGIALGASAGAYVNVVLNYRTLSRRTDGIMDATRLRATVVSLLAVTPATLAALAIQQRMAPAAVWVPAFSTLTVFGVVYLALTYGLGHPQATRWRRS